MTRVALKEAAQILHELQICKAYGPSGKINGPNCQLGEARKRRSAPDRVIEEVGNRYTKSKEPREADVGASPPGPSRAELEKRFRDSAIKLESVLRKAMQCPPSDRSTLGMLIHDAEDVHLLGRVRVQEARFVRDVRNNLSHPSSESIPDDAIIRAIESARALVAYLAS